MSLVSVPKPPFHNGREPGQQTCLRDLLSTIAEFRHQRNYSLRVVWLCGSARGPNRICNSANCVAARMLVQPDRPLDGAEAALVKRGLQGPWCPGIEVVQYNCGWKLLKQRGFADGHCFCKEQGTESPEHAVWCSQLLDRHKVGAYGSLELSSVLGETQPACLSQRAQKGRMPDKEDKEAAGHALHQGECK
eukprot:scaffold235739_cov44-Prasinocladus_malaysianus.AAC.4